MSASLRLDLHQAVSPLAPHTGEAVCHARAADMAIHDVIRGTPECCGRVGIRIGAAVREGGAFRSGTAVGTVRKSLQNRAHLESNDGLCERAAGGIEVKGSRLDCDRARTIVGDGQLPSRSIDPRFDLTQKKHAGCV